jgi:hypothetical protein
MIKISLLTQSIDFGLLKFIYTILNENNDIIIENILVAPKPNIHPIREKQLSIQDAIYARGENKLAFKYLKNIIVKLLLLILRLRHRFKIFYLHNNFQTNSLTFFKYTTIMYSYEGIMSREILDKFQNGIINIHPAILPTYRGLDGSLWALYENGKLGVSAYILDEGIDTGHIISTYELSDNFSSILGYKKQLKILKNNSFIDALRKYKSNQFECHNPKIIKSQNRGVMPEHIVKELIGRINRA